MFHWGRRGRVGPDVLHSESSGILAGWRDGTAKGVRPGPTSRRTDWPVGNSELFLLIIHSHMRQRCLAVFGLNNLVIWDWGRCNLAVYSGLWPSHTCSWQPTRVVSTDPCLPALIHYIGSKGIPLKENSHHFYIAIPSSQGRLLFSCHCYQCWGWPISVPVAFLPLSRPWPGPQHPTRVVFTRLPICPLDMDGCSSVLAAS